MKTKKIAEKAMELYPHYSTEKSMSQIDEWTGNEIQQIKRDYYIHGYKDCNAEWQEKTRWIPVKERLPELGKDVIIKSGTGKLRIGHLQDGDWIVEDDCYAFNIITHWKEII